MMQVNMAWSGYTSAAVTSARLPDLDALVRLAAFTERSLALTLTIALASAVPVGAQAVQSADDLGWAQTRTTPAGDHVRIVLNDGVSRQGGFLTADDQSITLSDGGREEHLLRAQVREVSVAR